MSPPNLSAAIVPSRLPKTCLRKPDACACVDTWFVLLQFLSHLHSNKQPIKASETSAAQWSADKAGSQQMHNFVRDEKVTLTLSVGQSSLTWKQVSCEYFLALRYTCYFEKRKRPFFLWDCVPSPLTAGPLVFAFPTQPPDIVDIPGTTIYSGLQ